MEKINTLKPDYKVMRMILNQTMRMNGSRATSAVTVKFILQYLLYAIATVPSMLGIMSGRIGLSTILLSPVLILAVSIVDQILDYGMRVTFSRMIEKREATLSHLFSGFRDRSKKVLKVALAMTVLAVIVVSAVSFATWKILCATGMLSFDSDAVENGAEVMQKLWTSSTVLSGVIGVTLFIIKIPFVYIWLVVYRRGDLGVFRALRISAGLLFGQFFRFVGFVFYAAGREIGIWIAMMVLGNIFSQMDSSSMLTVFAGLISFLQLLQQIRVLIKLNFVTPVYFYSMTGILEVHVSEYSKDETLEIPSANVDESDCDSETEIRPEIDLNPESEKLSGTDSQTETEVDTENDSSDHLGSES